MPWKKAVGTKWPTSCVVMSGHSIQTKPFSSVWMALHRNTKPSMQNWTFTMQPYHLFLWLNNSSFHELARQYRTSYMVCEARNHSRNRRLKTADDKELFSVKIKLLLLEQMQTKNFLFHQTTFPYRFFSVKLRFFGPGGLLQSAGRTKWMTKKAFDENYPTIRDAQQAFAVLMLGHLYEKDNDQGLPERSNSTKVQISGAEANS